MKNIKEIDKDLNDKLQGISDKENALLLSFIASEKIVRKSPIAYDYATITTQDLYNVEKVIEELRSKDNLPKKLHLIIQTPGGAADASLKIANYLRNNFDEIEAYVPYEAASGGTILCLAANKIVMGMTSNLTPIDPQLRYKGQWISSTSYKQAIASFQKDYGNLRPEEIPSPNQQIANQFDPVILEEMNKLVLDSLTTAHKLLTKSQKPKTPIEEDSLILVAVNLGRTNYPHSHIINVEEARSIGLNVVDSSDKLELLAVYKKWVSCRLTEEETTHIIDSYYPTIKNDQNTVQAQSTLQQQGGNR